MGVNARLTRKGRIKSGYVDFSIASNDIVEELSPLQRIMSFRSEAKHTVTGLALATSTTPRLGGGLFRHTASLAGRRRDLQSVFPIVPSGRKRPSLLSYQRSLRLTERAPLSGPG